MKPDSLHKRPAPLSVGSVHRAAAQTGAFHPYSGAPCLGELWLQVPEGSLVFLRNLSLENCKLISEKGTGFEQGLPLNWQTTSWDR